MDSAARPRLLDLFCGAGGAAMGYYRAGFEVVGVDVKPQPHYPFEFWRMDFREALTLEAFSWKPQPFDAIHASPPCQAYSVANNIHRATHHPRLIEPTRALLRTTGLPYVIENVPGAPLDPWVNICGLSLGLNVKRHRWFESNILLFGTQCGSHEGDWPLVFGHTVLERAHQLGRTPKNGPILRRKHVGTDRGREAMGISWMNRDELSEAIPPAYTEFIGGQLLTALTKEAA